MGRGGQLLAIGPTTKFVGGESSLQSSHIVHEESASGAMERLSDGDVSSIVLAPELSDRDVVAFIEELREQYPSLPIIYCSNDSSKTRAAIAAGATDCLRVEASTAMLEARLDTIHGTDANEATTYREQIRALHSVGVDLAACDSRAEAYELTVNAGQEILEMDICAVFIVDEDRLTLEESVGGLTEGGYFEPKVDSPEGGHATKAFQSGEPILTDDMLASPDANPQNDYRSVITVPVGEFGVFQAVSFDVGAFDQTDLELAEILTSHLRAALERLEGKSRLKRQHEQIERLHNVGVDLASCESNDEISELIVDAGEDILDLDMCIVGLVEDGRLRLGASSSGIAADGYREPPIDSDDAGLAGVCYRTNEARLIDDLNECEDADPAGEYRSALMIPVGEYGVFQAVARETGAFDETDYELANILAKHGHEAFDRIEQTERLERRREQLQSENERLEEFTSIVSHDLRNPLNVASLNLELVAEETDNERLEKAADAIDRAETLIDDLLALARDGESVSEFATVDLGQAARDAWANVQTNGASLTVETDASVEADGSRLQQLLANLFRNSVEHGSTSRRSQTPEDAVEHGMDEPETDPLTVMVGWQDTGFYVEDTGTGVAEAIEDDLFESGVSTSGSGTGIGLTIVNRIAKAHGWSVAEAESDSGGARFEFSNVSRTRDN